MEYTGSLRCVLQSYNILKFEVDQTNIYGDMACQSFGKILANIPPLPPGDTSGGQSWN